MAERKRAQTLDTATALEILDDHQVSGPLGRLNDVSAGLPKNDLPWDTAGSYEPTDENRLAAIMAEVGQESDDGFVSIWKINEQTRKMEYVDRRSNAEFELNGLPYLAKQFGAGEYELRVYGGNKRLHSRPRVTVSKAAANLAQTVVARDSGGNDLSPLIKVMADGFQQLGQLIVQSRPQAESRTQVLNELMQMKQIFGGDKSAADPMAMLTQVLTLAKQLQPRSDEGGPGLFVDLADRFMPVVMEAMKTQQTAPLAIAAPQALPTAGAAQHAHQPQPGAALSPEQQGAKQMSFQLKMQLGYLCSQAARDADPGPYAAIIADQVPKEVLDSLVNDPNWLDALAKFHEGVRKFPEWFNELHDAVISELTEPDLTATGEPVIQGENSPDEAQNVPGPDNGDS